MPETRWCYGNMLRRNVTRPVTPAVSGFMAVGGLGGSWFKMIGGSLGRHL